MTHVERTVARFALIFALLALPSLAHAQAPTLDSVLARFARIEGLTLDYHEDKHISLLSTPLTTDGTLAYARPGRLARRAGTQVVVIDGSALRMTDAGHEQRIDLGSQPIVSSFVDSFRAFLAGDRRALEQSYTVTFASTAPSWTITLTPRAAPLNQFMTSIVFHGTGDALVSMVMTETSGDTTTTTFSHVDDHHRFSTEETARLFGAH